jgi:hypothetical protein
MGLIVNYREQGGFGYMSYYHKAGPGDPDYNQIMTQAELTAEVTGGVNCWSRFIWPEGTTPPAEIRPQQEYTVSLSNATVFVNAFKAILGPRYRAALTVEKTLQSSVEVSLLK